MANLQKIKILCEQRNIQQKELAKRVGITSQSIIDMINRNSTKTEILEKIAKELNVPVGYFFDETPYSVYGNQNQINNGVGQQILMTPDQREIENLKELLKEKERFIQHLLNQNK